MNLAGVSGGMDSREGDPDVDKAVRASSQMQRCWGGEDVRNR